MKIIYISGKYRGQSENEVFDNIVHARNAAFKLWNDGWSVICPHTNTMFMGTRLGDKMFMEGDLEILSRCDGIYMLVGFRSSIGAMQEYELALELGVEIFYEDPVGKC